MSPKRSFHWCWTRSQWSRTLKVLAVTVQTKPDLVVGPTVLFFGLALSPDTTTVNYDVGPDRRFLMIESTSGDAPATANVVLNWFEELRRLSPK